MSRYLNYFYLLIAIIIWGLAPSIVKIVLEKLDPIPFLFLRFLVVVLFLAPLFYKIFTKMKFSLYDWKNIIIYSVLSQTSLILFFVAMDYTTATDAIILTLSAPLITIAAGHYFFRDKLNLLKEVGIVVSTLGTLLIVIEPLLSNNSENSASERIFGNFLLILFHVVASLWVIYSKFLFGENSVLLVKLFKKVGFKLHKKKYPVYETNMLSFLVALFTVLPLLFWDFGKYTTQISSLEAREILGIIYMGIFSSAIAYILYTKAQAKLSVTEVSIFTYISPVFALPASYLILNEIPSNYSYIGIAIIILGLFIAEKSPKT
jgi:drug/metabolite transporter (DMT)-like permease